MKHVVVVGAGQAGFSFVSKLRNLGSEDTITLIGSESAPPYQRPPLSKNIYWVKWILKGYIYDH